MSAIDGIPYRKVYVTNGKQLFTLHQSRTRRLIILTGHFGLHGIGQNICSFHTELMIQVKYQFPFLKVVFPSSYGQIHIDLLRVHATTRAQQKFGRSRYSHYAGQMFEPSDQ